MPVRQNQGDRGAHVVGRLWDIMRTTCRLLCLPCLRARDACIHRTPAGGPPGAGGPDAYPGGAPIAPPGGPIGTPPGGPIGTPPGGMLLPREGGPDVRNDVCSYVCNHVCSTTHDQ